MTKKVRTEISKIEINECTYNGKVIDPTLINFFYGRNGSGKSTLARVISENRCLTWKDRSDDVKIMVFDKKYVDETVSEYDKKIKGVFTLAEDAKEREELDEKIKERINVISELKEKQGEVKKFETRIQELKKDYGDEVWERTRLVREKFFPKLEYPGAKKNLFRDLLQCKPTQKDIESLHTQYKIIYDEVQAEYELYKTIEHINFPSSEIIYKPIISRSDTDFAKFVRSLGNLEWLRDGYDKYLHKSGGKCPFCQRENIDISSLEDLFDVQYKKDTDELNAFIMDYKDVYEKVTAILNENLKNSYLLMPELVQSYHRRCDIFREKAEKNLKLLGDKQRDLSLELNGFYDLYLFLKQISYCIEKINAEITKYMTLIMDVKKEQDRFYNDVCSFMAFNCQDLFSKYYEELANIKRKIREKKQDIEEKSKYLSVLNKRIDELSQVNTTTVKVMQLINTTLKNIGFKGFLLRQKIDEPHLYEIVRDNGEIVKDSLSEGERNFIAFLYFYHTVMHTTERDGTIHNKIVVIDDPVSSLDQQSIFYVAVLTREMIEICYNNYELHEESKENHIKQIFCLTHNPAFFYDISHSMLNEYECVSFFEIFKDEENQTEVKETIDENKASKGISCNKSPVTSHYESLWTDFYSTKNKDYLMSIARQIIYYHFIRTGGYNPSVFRDMLFNTTKQSNDKKNADIYRIANAMIGLLDIGITSFNDGISFNVSAYTLAEMRNAFEIIFSAMNQEQHYEMMTKRYSNEINKD